MKILLLDTNVSSFPIYNILVSKGHDVYVIGIKPDDCLAKHVKNYINCNYSDISALNKILKEQSFDLVVPGSNDLSYLTATKADINKFGLDSTETTEIINNKAKFRKFATEHHLSVPQTFSRDQAYSSSIPLIVKPVDAYSGRGTTVIKDITSKNVDAAIEASVNFSMSKNYVIEEYVEGQLYSHSCFIKDKKIFVDFIVIEDSTANKFTVDTSHVVYDFPKKMLNAIRDEIHNMANALDLVDGLVHTQFIKTKDSFRLIEITRRCPGDLYSLLIEKSTGFKYAEHYAMAFLGEDIIIKKQKLSKNNILRHTLSLPETSPFLGVKYNTPLNIDLFIPLSKTGEEVKQSPFGRIGLVFVKCKSYMEMKKLYKQLLKRGLYDPVK